MRPRVLVVCDSLDTRGGTGAILAGELEALAQRTELELLVPAGTRSPWPQHELRLPRLPGLLWTELWLQAAGRAMRRLAPRYDRVYAPGVHGIGASHITIHAVFAELVALRRRRARLPGDLRPRALHADLRSRRLASWERRVLQGRNRPRVATVSPRAAAVLAAAHPGTRARVLLPAPDRKRFAPELRRERRSVLRQTLGITDDERLLVTVGNAAWNKGFDRIAAALRERPGRWRWLVLGRERRIDVDRRFGGLPPGTLWLARLPEIADLYAAADLLALPGRGETFGLPVAEAGLTGCPVLATPEVGVADLLPEAARIPARHGDWLATLDRLEDPAAREQLGTRVRETLEIALPTPEARGADFVDWLLEPTAGSPS